MLYDNPEQMPIKLGDKVMIDKGGYNKNELRPFFVVTASEDFPTGVNFDDGLVCTVKDKTSFRKWYIWQLSWVQEVVDGSSTQLRFITTNVGKNYSLKKGYDSPYDIKGSDPYVDNLRTRVITSDWPTKQKEIVAPVEIEVEPVQETKLASTIELADSSYDIVPTPDTSGVNLSQNSMPIELEDDDVNEVKLHLSDSEDDIEEIVAPANVAMDRSF